MSSSSIDSDSTNKLGGSTPVDSSDDLSSTNSSSSDLRSVQSYKNQDNKRNDPDGSEVACHEVIVYEPSNNNPPEVDDQDKDLNNSATEQQPNNDHTCTTVPVDKEAYDYLIKSSPWIAIVSNLVGYGPTGIVNRYGIPRDYEMIECISLPLGVSVFI